MGKSETPLVLISVCAFSAPINNTVDPGYDWEPKRHNREPTSSFSVIIVPLKQIGEWITIQLSQTIEIACQLHPLSQACQCVGLVKISFLIWICNDLLLVSSPESYLEYSDNVTMCL